MAGKDINAKRKAEHIKICLDDDVEYNKISAGFSDYVFLHQALPEIDFNNINTSISLFGKKLSFPLIISSMTGGTPILQEINSRLAGLASRFNIAMGLGSLRIALEDDTSVKYFQVRKTAPDILLFANLGAVQLNRGFGPDHCKRAVDISGADGLMLHVNAMQEVFQSEGDCDFSDLLVKIEEVCKNCDFPVIVKEVGFGISGDVAKKLIEAGVDAIDIAGSGGTSWVKIESKRSPDKIIKGISKSFDEWGIPTADSLQYLKSLKVKVPIIASGGIRSGLDLAKSIALGADIGGIALPILRALESSRQAASDYIEGIKRGLKIAMFGIGASGIDDLKNTKSILKRK